jgi:AcrR family transcriptional regulator
MTDRDTLRGVTIRALSEALDVPPMTLYANFSSKNELFDLMYFEVAERLFADVEVATWQEALRSVGSNLRRLLSEHPNWAPLFSRPAPPLRSPGRERLLGRLQEGGLTADQAFVALSTVLLSSLGMMLIELELRAASGGAGVTERLEALRQDTDDASPSERPLTQQALKGLDSLQLGHLHEQTLDLLLAGVELRLAAKTSSD